MTKSIVLTVCEQHQISPAAFFGKGRTQKLSHARRDAIVALSAAEFGTQAIARLIKRDTSTVIYWLNQTSRDRRKLRLCVNQTTKRSEAEKREHLACLKGTLQACVDELRKIEPAFLAKIHPMEMAA